MPWYIPIITAVIAAVAAWWIRSYFDKSASRELLRREIFREYMALTDSGEYGPYVLQRVGALRLTKDEFGALLDDIAKTGRTPLEDGKEHDFIGGFGLFEVLHFVSSRNKEARSELLIYETLVEAIDDISPPQQS